MKYKSENFEEVDGSAFHKYKSKYEELYFNRNNNLDNWKSYKNYLEELLKRNKIQHHLKDELYNDGRLKIKSSYVRNAPLKTEPNNIFEVEEEPSLSPSFGGMRTPQLQKKLSEKVTGADREPKSVKLPKLVKTGGEKENLKKNIKKMMN